MQTSEWKVLDWDIKDMTGYEPLTTYYMDFGIAELLGTSAINDTFKEATGKDGYAMSDYKVMTELVMVLNWKMWEHEADEALCKLYYDLWCKAEELVNKTFNTEQLNYFYRITD